jgi:hypothetical protein
MIMWHPKEIIQQQQEEEHLQTHYVLLALKDPQDLLVPEDLKVHKDLKEPKETKVALDAKDLKAHKVTKVWLVVPVATEDFLFT